MKVESDDLAIRAKSAIVDIPPTLAGRIDYHPALPAARDQLTQRLGQGTLTKVTAVDPTPFWRAQGLTGTAVSADGLVNATFDDSPPAGTLGVLFGFVGGDSARAYDRLHDLRGPADRQLGQAHRHRPARRVQADHDPDRARQGDREAAFGEAAQEGAAHRGEGAQRQGHAEPHGLGEVGMALGSAPRRAGRSRPFDGV